MKELRSLVGRNFTLFFKDKGAFFTSLITPMILLVLYVTFLADVYRSVFVEVLPVTVPETLLNGFVGGQLLSSLLAVSCVTVSFCANMRMVADKVTGAARDLAMTPVKPWALAMGYYLAVFGATLFVCLVAMGAGSLYLWKVGWYLSWGDVALLLADMVLLVLFGTALSSIINHFLTTQGQISAVGAIVSSGYGFICGAYMPISNFAPGLQKVLVCLPGTYGTSLLRCHAMAGVYREMEKLGYPETAIANLREGVDCDIRVGDTLVSEPTKFLIMGGTVILLLAVYILLVRLSRKKR